MRGFVLGVAVGVAGAGFYWGHIQLNVDAAKKTVNVTTE